MGGVNNQELLRYFNDRDTWLVEADEVPPRVTRYAANESEEGKRKAADQSLGENSVH